MNWYKDLTKEKDWGAFLGKFHDRRESKRKEAESKAAVLGHYLDAWTVMDNCRCKKCGAYAKINNVFCPTDAEEFYGNAFLSKCHVNFDNAEDYDFSKFKNPNPKISLT